MARNPSQNSRAKVDLSFQFSSHTITALRAMPGGSSCPKWNNKMMEDICIHFILDTTTAETSLVILSSWQGKTCRVTRLQFVNQTSCTTRGPLRLVCQHGLCPWTLLWVCGHVFILAWDFSTLCDGCPDWGVLRCPLFMKGKLGFRRVFYIKLNQLNNHTRSKQHTYGIRCKTFYWGFSHFNFFHGYLVENPI